MVILGGGVGLLSEVPLSEVPLNRERSIAVSNGEGRWKVGAAAGDTEVPRT